MSESELPTDPAGLSPHHLCEHCAPLLAKFDQLESRYADVLALITKPPWLDAVLNASLGTSAALEVRDEVVELKERVASLEGTCDEQHPERRCPILLPPNGSGG